MANIKISGRGKFLEITDNSKSLANIKISGRESFLKFMKTLNLIKEPAMLEKFGKPPLIFKSWELRE